MDDLIEVLRAALLTAKVEHLVVDEDCWFSCPKSGACCNDTIPEDQCNCGADEHNARIDDVLARSER